MKIILASSSPQRKILLAGLGVLFTVEPSSVDEDSHPELEPRARSLVLAELKAQDVASRHAGSVVIGCDTLVVAPDGTLLEKPNDVEDAKRMLCLQSGGTSIVHSGLAVINPEGKLVSDVSSNRVTFKKLSDEDIAWWISTNQWKDRSGSFQIDGLGQLMISNVEGDWTSVVGLPVFLLGELMKKAGVGMVR
jgi:septum formation protein